MSASLEQIAAEWGPRLVGPCPQCGDGFLVARLNSKDGNVFLGCSDFNPHKSVYSNCKYVAPITDEKFLKEMEDFYGADAIKKRLLPPLDDGTLHHFEIISVSDLGQSGYFNKEQVAITFKCVECSSRPLVLIATKTLGHKSNLEKLFRGVNVAIIPQQDYDLEEVLTGKRVLGTVHKSPTGIILLESLWAKVELGKPKMIQFRDIPHGKKVISHS